MKRINTCIVENCIPTPASCIQWNGGDIDFLGVCNGEYLHNIIIEIVEKLQSIAGEDLSGFDIDSLLDICNKKFVGDVSLLHILNILKDNQICLKDYIDGLSELVSQLSNSKNVNVNLKCYADIDNIGNSLAITRDELDQLVINKLCKVDERLDVIEGRIVNLQEQIDDIDINTTVEELVFSTCVDDSEKPTSSQVKKIAEAHCDLENATGTSSNIASALSKVPSDWNSKYNLLPGWDNNIENQADVIGNMLLVINNLSARITFMEDNCCASSCEDIKLGFSAIFGDDNTTVIIKFTSGAGTSIPSGFIDKGSTGTIKDKNGNVETFSFVISNNGEVEVSIIGLDLTAPLNININAKLGNDALTCEKCLSKQIIPSSCGVCELIITGEDDNARVIIIYDDGSVTQNSNT